MKFLMINCEDTYGYLYLNNGEVVDCDMYDEYSPKNCYTAEILINSIHYAKIRNPEGRFIGFAGEYGVESHKEKCSRLLENYENKDSSFYKSLKRWFDRHGTLTPKQLACLEKIDNDKGTSRERSV